MTVYVLCALTSFLCTWLLTRGYRRTRVRLLMWSALCFAGLTLNNLLLIADRLVPTVELAIFRPIPAVIGVALLVWGMVRDTA